jgi:hypothetical protein
MQNIATNYEIELFVTTTRTTTVNVQVTAPKYSSGINEQFTVTSGVVKQLFFTPDLRMSGSSKSNKGILVSADDEVVIYGVNKEQYSNAMFCMYPMMNSVPALSGAKVRNKMFQFKFKLQSKVGKFQ